MKSITQAFEMSQIYNYLNKELFDNKLEENLILGLRHSLGTEGSFLHGKWDDSKQKSSHHEILIDENLLNEEREYWLAVLVHQMVHLWQYQYGNNKPTKHYHNEEFANKMQSIGLIIHTGYPNKQSINPDGKFMQVAQGLISSQEELLSLKPRNASAQLGDNQSKNGKKFKYSCPKCNASVWGKFGLSINCGICDKSMELQE
ncbi:SprT-like domain-containing protein [Nostoc punctiforme FACHB-252]|uniref:SprT-like domain-containing protein n=1 Tax=Nostoc punctiforme FACHB-252 TaxID=1357509 RepID=A0ABR8H8C8_NOSPU|nr:SprT-like domain-containing protein [Nostoc punctiforme]MBD2611521.1 SprT-like domain-containing protein [Nostoc punctiforme FACHB-252]